LCSCGEHGCKSTDYSGCGIIKRADVWRVLSCVS
jgi:hypothetical protein